MSSEDLHRSTVISLRLKLSIHSTYMMFVHIQRLTEGTSFMLSYVYLYNLRNESSTAFFTALSTVEVTAPTYLIHLWVQYPKVVILAWNICSWFLEDIGTQTPAQYSSNLMRHIHPALPQYGATWAQRLESWKTVRQSSWGAKIRSLPRIEKK